MTAKNADRLHWIKYNPTEWQGQFCDLTDEEYGLFHRVCARLWATSGNRMPLADLMQSMRVPAGSPRAVLIERLMGYALKEGSDGRLHVPVLDEAFADVVKRSTAAKTGSSARWAGRKAPKETNSVDF